MKRFALYTLPLPLALWLACFAGSAGAQESGAVTPYRPSVSSPAQLPAVGQLEFEAGLLSIRDSGARRDSVPVLFKLALSPQWGVLVGGDMLVSARDDAGNRTRGLGDTNVELKRAFLIDSTTALGLEPAGLVVDDHVPLRDGRPSLAEPTRGADAGHRHDR